MAYTTINENENGSLPLFGGDVIWKSDDWTDSDDRVRGGKSQSYLDCSEKSGRFYGTLDIKTLGGAGFASQRTTGDDRTWDLSKYVGMQLAIAKGDKKRYTIILKDTLLAANPENGREQATISWECDFELPPQTETGSTTDREVFIPWSSLNPTYRGKLKKDAKPINLKTVKRFSIMMRSFFGTQEGDFSLTIRSIKALKKTPQPLEGQIVEPDVSKLEKGEYAASATLNEATARPQTLSARALRYLWWTIGWCVAVHITSEYLVTPFMLWIENTT